MREASHLMLDREQELAGVEIDDVAEAILVLIVLAVDEAALVQPPVRTGEVRNVDLDMMLVEVGQGLVGLAEQQLLVLADLDARDRAVAVRDLGWRADHLRIEAGDAFGAADRDVELDIGEAKRDAAEARGVGLVAADAIAPGAGGFDVIVVLGEGEARAVELLA